jgi:hypothetical protein
VSDEEVDEPWRSSNHEDHLTKTLFTLYWCRIIEDDGSGDLLSRTQMHVDERDEIALPT